MAGFLATTLIWACSNPATVGDVAASPHLYYGKPGAFEFGRTLIARRGYAVLHDDTAKTPLWVSYRLRGDEINDPGPRPSWKPDPDLFSGFRAEDKDYVNSGFERGHMAANADITKDRASQVETFFLSNVVPQDGDNNAGIWARLEARGRDYARRYYEVFVITGPIFDKPLEDGTIHLKPAIGAHAVRVPTHLFKIFIRKTPAGYTKTLALIIPNLPIPPLNYGHTPAQLLEMRKPGRLRTGISATDAEYDAAQVQFLTTIDRIEEQTGLNFLNALPISKQNAIEKKTAPKMW